jgi:2-amino-4-hydroxy-6-hydroxymethyldihydropteridine diphosphokinase
MPLANQLCLCGMSVELSQRTTLLALGSNQPSTHDKSSIAVLTCALALLLSRGIVPIARSHYYLSEPLGTVRQAAYVNAVVAVECDKSIGLILREIKQIERAMGRRTGVRWGPRVLDIDIVTHRGQYASGQSLGWVDKTSRSTAWRRGQVVLPHPESHRRKFVLQPICDILPHWHHPIYNASAQQILRRLPQQRQSRLVQLAIDCSNGVCNKA